MDFDAGVGGALGGAIGGAIATILDWLDRRRVDDKFGQLGKEINTMENTLARQSAEIKNIEKNQDKNGDHLESMNKKIDTLISAVGEIKGTLSK
jgi:septal ring factor EnvC (AmiA/AmiB activator)